MKTAKPLLILVILLTVGALIPHAFSQSHSQIYQLLDESDGATVYRLNVTVQQSLYQYYMEKTHWLSSDTDFAKFVTPYALKPIADNLATIYVDDEDFVNGALMLVHQIPYEVTGPSKYPVETIVENKGDCDLFSYVAASIIKAHGIDVVLLYYESEAHMNIGVSLSQTPQDARDQAYYITYNNIRYYMAEVTGDNWQDGWRVGECPDQLKDASVQVITLENSEQSTYGQVSASLKTLASSAISLAISQTFLIQGATATVSGQLTPTQENSLVTIYVKANTASWVVLGTAATDKDGKFAYTWIVDSTGICYVRASWSGNADYAGSDSQILTVTVLSTFFILLLALTAVLIVVGIVVFALSRHSQAQIQEPQPPEIPQ
jgi:hypothetical protein